MRVYVDLDSRAFVVSPTLLQRVSTMFFTRRDALPLEVQFVRNGAVVELASGATGKFGIKAAGSFDGAFLAYAGSWTKTGTTTSTVYTLTLNVNSTELDELFPGDDEESVSGVCELEWTVGTTVSSTLPCAATIYNDVIRETQTGSDGVANVRLTILQGSTFSQQFVWKTGDPATPADLTSYTARAQARATYTSSTAIFDLTTANGGITLGGTAGTITLALSSTATAALTPGNYVWDLELTLGSTVRRLIAGKLTVSPEVTQ
jgi:hypothetical protein